MLLVLVGHGIGRGHVAGTPFPEQPSKKHNEPELLQPCPTPGLIRYALVALQPYSSTPVALSYSSHGRTDIPLLTMTLGLVSIQPLPHLSVYPVLM